MNLSKIDLRQAYQRQLTCACCGAEPDFALGADAVRFICTKCTTEALTKNGRPLRFPRSEQDEMFLTSAPLPV